MIEFKPTALYSREDLIELMKPFGIDGDGWLAKIRPARRFRRAYWGADLIRAIEETPEIGDTGEPKLAEKLNRHRAGQNAPERVDAPGSLLIRELLSESEEEP